jgi:hypothetical protein
MKDSAMSHNRIVPIKTGKNKPPGALALAEETISRQGIEDALRAAAFAYDRRLEALRADAAARECSLQEEYLAEVARIVAEA